ncbi:MAG: hypothetical protein ACOYXT_01370, partial [Bacteroidota bacterium]
YYYQFGYDRSDAQVNASLISLSLTLTNAKSAYTFGFDQLTGTPVNDTQSNTFDPLFGTHHKFYGLMDYFYVGSPHIQQGKTIGLQDFFNRSKFNLKPTTILFVELHHFLSPVQIIDPENVANTLPRTLGTEIDLVLQHSFHKDFVAHLGLSQMFATHSMEAIKGNGNAYSTWAWLMLTFKPELLNSDLLSKR